MSAQPSCNLITENPADGLLDTIVLIPCGELIFDYFNRFKCTKNKTANRGDFSFYGVSDTFVDLFLEKAFNWLYDMMSQDFEYAVNVTNKTLMKLKLCEDIYYFVRQYIPLHEINR